MHNLLNLPNLFDEEIWNVLEQLFANYFHVTLIGGATRDYLIKNELSKDLDFEIRHRGYFAGKDWERKLDSLFSNLSSDLNVEKLSYNVYKIKLKEVELEFSSARIEVFRHDDNSHSNFDCIFQSQMEYERAFKRRDFTCNAIGLEMKSKRKEDWQVVDPFNGLNDISAKRLNYCSQDFSLDPVRFLRAIRFHLKMNFDITPTLIEAMKKMNLEKLSSYYFFSEYKKSKSSDFFKLFFKYIDNFELILSQTLSSLSFLKKLGFKNNIEVADLFVLACYQGLIQKEEIGELCSLFGLKKKYAQQIFVFLEGLKRIDENFIKTLKNQDFQVVKNIPDFLFAHSVVHFINTNAEQAASVMGLVDKRISLGEMVKEENVTMNSEYHLMQSYHRLKTAVILS